MDMFVVRGGRPLRGRVRISGAKNAALPIMAAALAADGPTTLKDVPHLVDVQTLRAVLQSLGVESSHADDGTLRLEVTDSTPCTADYELVRRMRASVCVLGPLLGRRGRACVSLPGGCNIGHRPVDLHLKGLRALGADLKIERGYVIAEAQQLRGARVFLGGPFGSTVTGTCNILSAAVFAEGTTTIEAAACEPEVVDLGNFLIAMGARIRGLGTPFIEVDGVEQLTGAEWTIIPDRVEAATFMIAAAMTSGDITLENVRADHLTAVLEVLKEIGVDIVPRGGNRLEIRRTGPLRATDITALPYPGVPTDVQAQLTALLCLARGTSVVNDKVFPDRFMHVSELLRMAASIRRENASAIIAGVERFSGASVMASDLRASAALVLAGLAAEGESVVKRIYHLDRGYEQLEVKLNRLGADVRRVIDSPENVPASLCVSQEIRPPVLKGPNWAKRATDTGGAVRDVTE